MTTGSTHSHRSIYAYLSLALKGFCMGAADVVPGVSGGTMALILGIYEELIQAIRSVVMAFIRRLYQGRLREALNGVPWPFLLALGMGILTAILSLARVIGWMLGNYPVYVWSFFFGLVLASVVAVGRQMDRWTAGTVSWMIMGALGAYWVVGIVPINTPETPLFLFLSGAVAICAMILPGISGSFILVLLGKYQFVLNAVNQRDFLILFIFGMGAAAGLLCFVRLLNWLLLRYRTWTLASLVGLMMGSLRKVWPWKLTGSGVYDVNHMPTQFSSEVMTAVGLMVLGLLAVWGLNTLAKYQRSG